MVAWRVARAANGSPHLHEEIGLLILRRKKRSRIYCREGAIKFRWIAGNDLSNPCGSLRSAGLSSAHRLYCDGLLFGLLGQVRNGWVEAVIADYDNFEMPMPQEDQDQLPHGHVSLEFLEVCAAIRAVHLQGAIRDNEDAGLDDALDDPAQQSIYGPVGRSDVACFPLDADAQPVDDLEVIDGAGCVPAHDMTSDPVAHAWVLLERRRVFDLVRPAVFRDEIVLFHHRAVERLHGFYAIGKMLGIGAGANDQLPAAPGVIDTADCLHHFVPKRAERALLFFPQVVSEGDVFDDFHGPLL